jgi:hypothetical protein
MSVSISATTGSFAIQYSHAFIACRGPASTERPHSREQCRALRPGFPFCYPGQQRLYTQRRKAASPALVGAPVQAGGETGRREGCASRSRAPPSPGLEIPAYPEEGLVSNPPISYPANSGADFLPMIATQP